MSHFHVSVEPTESKYNIVRVLWLEGRFTEMEAGVLMLLINGNHPLVSAAHIALSMTEDLDDFVDTAQRIVKKVRES